MILLRGAAGVAEHHVLSMQVKQPDAKRARVTKMSKGKVFVVYHSALEEIDALSGAQIRQWHTLQLADKDKKGALLKALQSAEQALPMGLLFEVTCMPAVSTGQDGVEMTETIYQQFCISQADYGKFCLELSSSMY